MDLPKLKTVRPKWALSVTQAAQLLQALPPLATTMVGLALLSGVRRGELFALRWKDIDVEARDLTVREAVYEGAFDTPKTEASLRQIPLSDAPFQLMLDWRARTKNTEPEALVFATWSRKPISPNNVLRRHVYPAGEKLGFKRVSWITLRRTYSSWAHEKGVPGKVVAQLMGHTKVDTTLNVNTQVIDGALRTAADKVGSELSQLFTIWKERSSQLEKIGSPVWTTFATVDVGLRPVKDDEKRRTWRMAVLGAARSRLAIEQARPSNCLTRSFVIDQII